MKTWFLSLIASAAGIAAARFFGATAFVSATLPTICSFIVKIQVCLLIPVLLIALSSASASFKREKGTMLPVWTVNILWGLAISFIICALAVFAAGFIPLSFPKSISAAVSPLNGENNRIIAIASPVAAAAVILGLSFGSSKEKADPAFNALDAMSKAVFRLSRTFARLAPLFILLYSACYGASLFESGIIKTALLFSMELVVLTAGLSFVILPFFYRLFGGRNTFTTVLRTIPLALTSLFCASDAASRLAALETKHGNLGMQRRVASTTTVLNACTSRCGTAVFAAVALVSLCSFNTSDLKEIVLLSLFCVLFSLKCFAYPGLETVFVACAAASRFSIPQDSLFVLFAIYPIVNGLGLFVDSMQGALNAGLCAQAIGGRTKVKTKEAF